VPSALEVLPAEALLPELPPVAISLQRSKGSASVASDELVRHLRLHLARP
jgi:hypothetical protein